MDASQLLSLNIAKKSLCNTNKYLDDSGSTGSTGIPGNTGATGIQGPTGTSGVTGMTGYAANTGATGIQGHTGTTGVTGMTGYATNTGATGFTGFTGPVGVTGMTGYATNTGATGMTGPSGVANFGVIKFPKGLGALSPTTGINALAGISTLPLSFGTYNNETLETSNAPGNTPTNTSMFTITLNGQYSPSNLPYFNITAYMYSASGYLLVPKQLGSTGSPFFVQMTIDPNVSKITFNYCNTKVFENMINDSQGYCLYLCFNFLN